MATTPKARAPKIRERLARAIRATEEHLRPDEKDPAAYALAFLGGYLSDEAPEFCEGLRRVLKLHHERP